MFPSQLHHLARLESVHLAAGYAAVHNQLATRLDPQYGTHINSSGGQQQLTLNDEDLQVAARLYGLWNLAAHDPTHLGLAVSADPFRDCPACAQTYREALNDGATCCCCCCPSGLFQLKTCW